MWCCWNLILTNRESLVGDVKVGGNLGCCDHETVEFSIRQAGSRAASKIQSWTSAEVLLVSSEIFFKQFHGNMPCREKGSKRIN